MPKRKRSSNDEEDVDRIMRRRKQAAQDELIRSKKLLHRALKTAKGFERQKLSKRLKLATGKNEANEIKRINSEIEALKTLDLDKVTVAQLHRSLLKIRDFKDTEILPDEVRKELPKPEGTEEKVKAVHNITSGMCNAKLVREEIMGAVERMYGAMGIPIPRKEPKGKTAKEADKNAKFSRRDGEEKEILAEVDEKPTVVKREDDSENDSEDDSWDGLDSNKESEGPEGDADDQESLDEEELQQFDALLGASSDEESFHEDDWLPKERPEQTRFSFSPEPSLSPSISESLSSSPDPEPAAEVRPNKTTKSKSEPVKPGNSTFLPSLMGGYWSGSESEPSDFEDSRPVKKNRPGQMARRAIWEKKFGEKANHITSGQGPVASRGKDDGWDAKRGAKDTSGSGRGRGSHARENATPIQPKTEPVKPKRDDLGVLHPSWQAAKKAKEMKKTASFQGKKVTFD
ncbi:Bud-site selection protein [Mollisia scopiformis]|uniref:Bud-site selection protein n=1 Tax=Mollisia scopiformis TaxID=149040 RepID=A0A194WX96_MOLSC|nr:Bud-site selection protein [Mollisia scopiformis]KUJ12304.1 Bud-site selection protein [Mollisia scopiformis]